MRSLKFEQRHQPLASPGKFVFRMFKFGVISFMMVVGSLLFGVWGYEHFAGVYGIDAWHTAAMILFSEGPVTPMNTFAAKLWETIYAAFSGVAFFSAVGTFWTPVLHRVYHHCHLDIVASN